MHEKTLGGSTAIAQARPEIEQAAARRARHAARARTCRHPATTSACARFDGNLDRWFIYDFVLPGTLLMHSGGRPGRVTRPTTGSRAVRLHSCQTLTPETETTTHYFFQQSYLAAQDDRR